MHKEGIVVKVTDQLVVLLCNDGTFHNMKRAKEQVLLIGEKIDVIQKRNVSSLSYFSKLAAVACVAFFLLFSVGRFNKLDGVPAYVIAIDINPSIEVQVNESLHIVGLTALNQSGEKIVNSIDYKGKRLDEIIDQIISESYIYGFLDHTTTGLITSSIVPMSDNVKIDKDKVKALINNSLTKNKIHAEVQIAMDKKEVLKSAHALGITVNKYKIYKTLIDNGTQISTKVIKENSIKNLLKLTQNNNISREVIYEILNRNNQQLDSNINELKEDITSENKLEQINEDNHYDGADRDEEENSDSADVNEKYSNNEDKDDEVEDSVKLDENIGELEDPEKSVENLKEEEVEELDAYPELNKEESEEYIEIDIDTNNDEEQNEEENEEENEEKDEEKNEEKDEEQNDGEVEIDSD